MHRNQPHSDPEPHQPDVHLSPATPDRAVLHDAVARVAAGRPRWRRWLLRRWPGQSPVLAALGALLLLSLLGVAAPWSSSSSPAQYGIPGTDDSALPSPSPGGPQARGGTSRHEPADAGRSPAAPQGREQDCPAPLTVVAAPDIAGLVGEIARPMGGDCPPVEVHAQAEASTLATMAAGGSAPDVWIPGSTLWLRLATRGTGQLFETSGTSLARSPVVLAFPQPVHAEVADAGTWPVWVSIYDLVTDGGIDRMSMPDPATTEGALALVGLHAALSALSDGDRDATFLRTIHFRDSLATTDAHVDRLLAQLADSSPAAAASQVGVFPATEQRLLAYHDAGPAVPVVAVGMYDAFTSADYPMAVSGGLDSPQVAVAEELLAELRSPAAVQRLVTAGFRPPDDASIEPAALSDPDRFPSYPAPVPLPDPDGWQQLLDEWTWNG